jgi:hypothetical protein
MTRPDAATTAEHHRLAAVPTIATVAARHVGAMTELRGAELPAPLTRLGAPPAWRLANLEGCPIAPVRVLVSGPHPDGSWDGSETIRAFGFTGVLPPDVLRANADSALRALAADHLTAGALAAPPAATAVRSSGSFTAAGRHYWAQFSSFAVHPAAPALGLLLEHSIVTAAGARAGLARDITDLSDAFHHAFLACVADHTIGDSPGQDHGVESNHVPHQRISGDQLHD